MKDAFSTTCKYNCKKANATQFTNVYSIPKRNNVFIAHIPPSGSKINPINPIIIPVIFAVSISMFQFVFLMLEVFCFVQY